ncbi:MAG: HIT family protein [bacterium]
MLDDCEFCPFEIIENQCLCVYEGFCLIYPKKPIFKYHFILFPIQHDQMFHKINNFFEIKDFTNKIFSAFNKIDADCGYNIFSNNGSKAGQSGTHAHIHIFIRLSDEEKSPYDLLNNSSLRQEMNREEWVENRDRFRKMFVVKD